MINKEYEFTKGHTQIAKGVAITLMMIHHLFAFPDRIQSVSYISIIPFGNNNFEFLLGGFAKICVAMYLFLSGYGLYISSFKKGSFTFKDSAEKTLKFLINYWVVFIVFVPIGLIWFTNDIRYHFDIIIFLKNFFTLSYSYNFEWWFVRLYIELLLFFPLIKRILNRGIKSSLAITLSLYIISFGMEVLVKIKPQLAFLSKNIIYYDIITILFWQMTFCVGCLTAKYNLFSYISKWVSSKKLDKKVFYIAMILVIITIRTGFSYIFDRIGIGNASYVDFILAPPFILICTNFISQSQSENMFLTLGKHSTNMWLTHSFFCFYYFQRLVFVPKLSILIVIWLAVLSFTSSLLINFIIKSSSGFLQNKFYQKKKVY